MFTTALAVLFFVNCFSRPIFIKWLNFIDWFDFLVMNLIPVLNLNFGILFPQAYCMAVVSHILKCLLITALYFLMFFRYNAVKQLDSSTETSCLSDGIHSLSLDSESALKKEPNRKLQLSVLQSRGSLII